MASISAVSFHMSKIESLSANI